MVRLQPQLLKQQTNWNHSQPAKNHQEPTEVRKPRHGVVWCRGVVWRRGVVVITTTQFHSTKPELRFCSGSKPACGVSEIRDVEDL